MCGAGKCPERWSARFGRAHWQTRGLLRDAETRGSQTGREHALLGVHRRGEYALRVRDNEYARVGHLG